MAASDDASKTKGTLGGSGNRDFLPGVSKKFNPIRAQTLWKAIVEKERRHLENMRTPTTGMRLEPLRQIDHGNADDVDVVKYVTYTRMVPAGSVVVPEAAIQKRQKPPGKFALPSRYEGFTEAEIAARKERDDFEETYRFFSRPYNVTQHKCEHFNGYRMNKLFDMRNKTDPILSTSDELRGRKEEYVRKMERDLSYDSVLKEAVKAYGCGRQRAVACGNQAQFGGYVWPRYKYFAGGKNYGTTGSVSRFPVVNSEEHTRGSREKFKRKTLLNEEERRSSEEKSGDPAVHRMIHPSAIFKTRA
ncbi:hypothetical protein FOZ63_005709 [Perkinsus olseni]|uniref:Uncharacterized protein n=1 Tax=Perkinsus olseni TaxID=32597 RepID=A0A7J6RP84_PEROL|nr:hypothetical protein FOZ63_005709 [Perkinsus olseni]